MALTDVEREWLEELVANISSSAAERAVDHMEDRLRQMLALHEASCLYGKRLNKYTFIFVGLAVGAGAAGSRAFDAVLTLIGGLG